MDDEAAQVVTGYTGDLEGRAQEIGEETDAPFHVGYGRRAEIPGLGMELVALHLEVKQGLGGKTPLYA